ncbi:MAG: 30S ribosomal protein S8 [Verrucomicrobia bacterium]|nr:MAG: 30S ribosomal protein S8 [Verrucomicrobiota bacterium]
MSVSSDPIADLLARLRNASHGRKNEFTVPYSKIKSDILHILKREGYIGDVALDTSKAHPVLKVRAKYVNRSSAIAGLRRISRPGLRKYVGSKCIPIVLGGMGVALLSTPQGILTGQEARRRNVGGEILAYVW